MSRLPKDDRERPTGVDTVSRETTASAGRFFLGVALTDESRRAIRLCLEAVEIPGSLVLPEDWHITLRFLGETTFETLATLREVLGTANLGPRFDVVLGRLGAFPNPDAAGVLWLGVDEGSAALTALAARLEPAAYRAGLPVVDRRFTPHLTVSWIRPPVDLRLLIGRVPALQVRMSVDAVVLYRRCSKGEPRRYEMIERFPLSSST